jgi:predicted phosphohydrolase
MKIYSIGDLHLSFKEPKPMDIFGDNWTNHAKKIKDNWISQITDEDYILIPGDISWAISLTDAMIDLEWINDLPGKKIISKGNHDYWWSSLKKMEGLFGTIKFLHNNFIPIGDYAICGTRGWNCPQEDNFTQDDLKIFSRELIRLTLSLDEAKKNGYNKIITMIHFPPTNDKLEMNRLIDIFKSYNVEQVIYGHLHSYYAFDYQFKGNIDNIMYRLVSADFLHFNPIRIL